MGRITWGVSMLSIERFLYRANSPADLPPPVILALQVQAGIPPATNVIVIPQQEYLKGGKGWPGGLFTRWRRTPRRTLAFDESQVTIVEMDGASALRVVVVPLCALLCVDLATTLLYAYLKLVWICPERIDMIRVEFNSVGIGIIEEQLKRLRPIIAVPVPCMALTPRSDIQNQIAALPYKFQTHLQLSLLTGESVIEVVYQPALQRSRGWPKRHLASNSTVAVTDRHIILLADEDVFGVQHSMIRRYVPLNRISRVTYEPTGDAVWMRLALGTAKAPYEIKIPLQTTNATSLDSALHATVPTHQS